jgi:hypothetical protein
MYLVTPCSRPENLERIKQSIQFDKIEKWYIVYDNRRFEFSKRYEGDEQIVEIECLDEGIAGHQCRNKSLDIILNSSTRGFVYFVDDDNIIHPNFWNFKFDPGEALAYTFHQQVNSHNVRTGNLPIPGCIDTAQYVVHTDTIGKNRFISDVYEADGMFINSIVDENMSTWKFINDVGCYYNFLRQI